MMGVLRAIRYACCLQPQSLPQIGTLLTCQVEDFRIQPTMPYDQKLIGSFDLTGERRLSQASSVVVGCEVLRFRTAVFYD